MKPRYPVAVVTWDDAWLKAHEEVDADQIDHSPETLHTVGFLIRRDKQGVTLAMEHNDSTVLRTVYFIPAAMIKGVRVIRK